MTHEKPLSPHGTAGMHSALLWAPLSQQRVQCVLCAHRCVIPVGSVGRCGVRHNRNGELLTCAYERIAAANLDPVEKKPLYHFLPGTMTLSFGTAGCNMRCAFCQNAPLSQARQSHRTSVTETQRRCSEGQRITPEALVAEALRLGAQSIAYTYSEPTIFFELMRDTATLAAEHGLYNILVSNGYQSIETLVALQGLIHACNIDLKAFSERFYRDVCGAHLAPVLDTLRAIHSMGWWLEVTTLLIPQTNDTDAEVRGIASFLRTELGANVPWHISRFQPAHTFRHLPPTPLEKMEQAWQIGREHELHFVYLGNVHGHPSEHTTCPSCGNVVVRRTGFRAIPHGVPRCPQCGYCIPGIWSNTA